MNNRNSSVGQNESPVAARPLGTTGSLSDEEFRRLIARFFEVGLLLLVGYFTWIASHLTIGDETKIQALSVIGLFIDPDRLISVQLLTALKITMFVLLGLWLMKRANRVVYVLAPLVFILIMSSVVETQYFARHQTHFCAMAFVVLGAARFFGSRRDKSFDTVDPLPAWAFMTLIFYIGMSYTFSGIGKLYYSGLQWGDGRALMMWVDVLAANRQNILFETIVENHLIAAVLQMTTLVAETGALLMLFMPRLRVILGVILVGFHASIEVLFGLGFYANIFLDFHLLILCYAVPQYRLLGSHFIRDLFAPSLGGVFADRSEPTVDGAQINVG